MPDRPARGARGPARHPRAGGAPKGTGRRTIQRERGHGSPARPPLDAGELESIALALESRADLVLLDEQAARGEARRLGLRVGGTLGVLVEARRRGYLRAVGPDVEALRRYGYWLSPRLVALVTADDARSPGDEEPR